MTPFQLAQLIRVSRMREDRQRRILAEQLAELDAARSALAAAIAGVSLAERGYHRADHHFRELPHCPQRQFSRDVADRLVLEAAAEKVNCEQALEDAESAAAQTRVLLRKAEERGRRLADIHQRERRTRAERIETTEQEDRAAPAAGRHA